MRERFLWRIKYTETTDIGQDLMNHTYERYFVTLSADLRKIEREIRDQCGAQCVAVGVLKAHYLGRCTLLDPTKTKVSDSAGFNIQAL